MDTAFSWEAPKKLLTALQTFDFAVIIQLLTDSTLVLVKCKIFLDNTSNRRTGNARFSLDFSRAFVAVRFVLLARDKLAYQLDVCVCPCRFWTSATRRPRSRTFAVNFLYDVIKRSTLPTFVRKLFHHTPRAPTFMSMQIPNQTKIVRR